MHSPNGWMYRKCEKRVLPTISVRPFAWKRNTIPTLLTNQSGRRLCYGREKNIRASASINSQYAK